jgi:hypothetical protein
MTSRKLLAALNFQWVAVSARTQTRLLSAKGIFPHVWKRLAAISAVLQNPERAG